MIPSQPLLPALLLCLPNVLEAAAFQGLSPKGNCSGRSFRLCEYGEVSSHLPVLLSGSKPCISLESHSKLGSAFQSLFQAKAECCATWIRCLTTCSLVWHSVPSRPVYLSSLLVSSEIVPTSLHSPPTRIPTPGSTHCSCGLSISNLEAC